MNCVRVDGYWKQVQSEINHSWSKLTDEHLEVISGKRDRLVSKIQECYGIAMEDAEQQVQEWEARTRVCLFETLQHAREQSDSVPR